MPTLREDDTNLDDYFERVVNSMTPGSEPQMMLACFYMLIKALIPSPSKRWKVYQKVVDEFCSIVAETAKEENFEAALAETNARHGGALKKLADS